MSTAVRGPGKCASTPADALVVELVKGSQLSDRMMRDLVAAAQAGWRQETLSQLDCADATTTHARTVTGAGRRARDKLIEALLGPALMVAFGSATSSDAGHVAATVAALGEAIARYDTTSPHTVSDWMIGYVTGRAHELQQQVDRCRPEPGAVTITRVKAALTGTLLSDTEVRVLTLRLGLDGNPPRTLDDTARELRLTRHQVRRVESTVLARLRRHPVARRR